MSQNSGLCVGGPLDGKVMVAGDRIRVQTPSIGPSMFDWADKT